MDEEDMEVVVDDVNGADDANNDMDGVNNDETDSKPNIPKKSMVEWFQSAPLDCCDEMISLQLDYRFKGDKFGTWWRVMQEVGVKYENQLYVLPPNPDGSQLRFAAHELYDYLDRLAIPIISNILSGFPPTPKFDTKDEEVWARKLRDEIIFRGMHEQIQNMHSDKVDDIPTQEQGGDYDDDDDATKESSGDAPPKQVTRRSTRVRASVTSSEPGADLLLKNQIKKKPRKSAKVVQSPRESDNQLHFPTVKEYAAKLKQYPLTEIVGLESAYDKYFHEWRFLVSTNHSLLLYGVGSKQIMLDRFAEQELEKDGDVLVLNGYDKDIAIEDILGLLVASYLDGQTPQFSMHEVNTHPLQSCRAGILFPVKGNMATVQKAISIGKMLAQKLQKTRQMLTIVIHSIDGVRLRSATAQEAMAALVFHSSTEKGVNTVRLVASTDHVNAPLSLWNSLTWASFSWIFQAVHTYRPYLEEIADGNVVEAGTQDVPSKRRKGDHIGGVVESILNVMKSLAPRLSEALQVLAKMQLKQQHMVPEGTTDAEKMGRIKTFVEDDASWIVYRKFLKECQLQAVVSGDQQLRTFLKELQDQDIVESQIQDGITTYRIPYNRRKIQEIIDYTR